MAKFRDIEKSWQAWLASDNYLKATMEIRYLALKLVKTVKKELAIERDFWRPWVEIPKDVELGEKSQIAFDKFLKFLEGEGNFISLKI